MRARASSLALAVVIVVVLLSPQAALAERRVEAQGKSSGESLQARLELTPGPPPASDRASSSSGATGAATQRVSRGGGAGGSTAVRDPARDALGDAVVDARCDSSTIVTGPGSTCPTPDPVSPSPRGAAPRPAGGAPAPAPVDVARSVLQEAPLPLPAVRTSPPPEIDQLVNLPLWMWLDNWAPVSVTAALPEAGASVTVTATPRSVTWDMGNGDRVVCAGPGTPYIPGAGNQASPDCGYTYRRSSAGQPNLQYQVSATMTWDASWTAAGVDGGGSLGQVSRTTTFGVRVAEIQTINTPVSG